MGAESLIWTLPGVWHSVSEPMLLHPVELAAAIGAAEIATAPAPAASRRVIALTLVRMFDTPSLGEGQPGLTPGLPSRGRLSSRLMPIRT
jgi:hypothetical protein